jgi:hypothetical protein
MCRAVNQEVQRQLRTEEGAPADLVLGIFVQRNADG